LEELRLSSQWAELTTEEQIRLREMVPFVEIDGTTVTMRLFDVQASKDAVTGAIQTIRDRLGELEDGLTRINVFHAKQRAAAVALSATLPTPTPEAAP
jgi:hypothetical protein